MSKELEKSKLSDQDLDNVSGGMVIQNPDGTYRAYSDDGKEGFPGYTTDAGLSQEIAKTAGWSDQVITDPVAPAKKKKK